ncbi:hypothetical protein PS1_008370 [Malus domestica]
MWLCRWRRAVGMKTHKMDLEWESESMSKNPSLIPKMMKNPSSSDLIEALVQDLLVDYSRISHLLESGSTEGLDGKFKKI